MEERFEEKNVFFSLSFFFSLISFQKYRRTSNTLLNIIIISTKTEYKGQKSKYRVKACTSLKRKITYNFSPLKFPIFSFIYNIHNTEFQFKQHLRRILLFFSQTIKCSFILLHLILILILIRHMRKKRKRKTRKNMLGLVPLFFITIITKASRG